MIDKISRGAWVYHRTHGPITVLKHKNGIISFAKGHVTIYGAPESDVFITQREMEPNQ